MIKSYATVILPLCFGALGMHLVRRFGADGVFPVILFVVVTLCLAALGHEIRDYYFRQVQDGEKGRIPRLLWFSLGLPGCYFLSVVVAVASFVVEPSYPPIIPAVLGMGTLLGSLWLLLQDDHFRGRRDYTQEYMAQVGQRNLPKGDPGFMLAGVPIATKEICTHIGLIGTTGSGKSTIIKEIIETAVAMIGNSLFSVRCIIFDPKSEFYTYVLNRAGCKVVSLHPFDQRGHSWAMCEDIRTPKAALQFAVTLIPRQEGTNAYFSNGARTILRNVVISYILNTPDDWTFRDIILGCETDTRLRAILSRDPLTSRPIKKFLDAREASSVLSDLETFVEEYSPLAACWSKSEPISLRKWADGEFVLILGQDEESPESLALINSLMLRFVKQQLLRHKTNDQLRAEGQKERLSFVILDELREIAQNLDKPLKDLLNRGRGYGVSFTGGWCSHSGMKDAVNQNVAPEIIGLCSYLGMLRVREEETAAYFANIIGKKQIYRRDPGTGAKRLETDDVVMPSAFSELGGDRFQGYFLAPPPLGLWKADMPWPWKGKPEEVKLKEGDKPPADFIPRPDTDQYLEPWTVDDLKRLKLPLDLFDQEKKDEKKAAEEKKREEKKEKLKEQLKVVIPSSHAAEM
jgi:hypothetical protein